MITKLFPKFLILFLIAYTPVWSQYDMNIHGGGQAIFNSYNDLKNGLTENRQITVQFKGSKKVNTPKKWKLTVRLLDDFYEGNYSVAAEMASLRINLQGGSNDYLAGSIIGRELPLSKFQESVIIETTAPISQTKPHKFSFDLAIKGGTHLLTIPNGTYTSTYEFTLYDTSSGMDRLLTRQTSSFGTARFQINYNGNYGNQLAELRNGASEFVFNFDTPAQRAQGMTIAIDNALYIKSYQGHQVMVKTADNLMYNTDMTHSLPVSLLKLKTTFNTIETGNQSDARLVQTYGPISLSTQEQTIAAFPKWSQSISYNLELSIPPGLKELQQASGRYETYLYFVIVPN
ncbi:hypothetical protein [Myroides pelagicus]|uniref:Uncharacterized protein n=1 Tax=Myroides pelagicus TaxID=270914 RepID=A0A7K1GQ07_9FLAO|nr:hypothetical protein [Myroides pelagicus]MTH30992.1 hypothetical protein [Myroides pelagicus]